MELNYDFVREILLTCAASTHPMGPSEDEIRKLADDYEVSLDQLAYTVTCLFQAGLVVNKVAYTLSGPYLVSPGNLTWDGNEYLNNIRNTSVWEETKDKVKKSGLSVSLQVLGAVATAVVKNKLGLN
ncbi:DUF2513 domain-containing protein [Lactobacillus sp. CBA3605]|uniref:DUF2513 domain-containing protein n=1 Tax=Lactobacillus sp. CBA3605 TaxID=2099788 RepID=UPI001319EED7|nr:DUF2513 domain-containing protein [Lactobacillus sp. CBA3605]